MNSCLCLSKKEHKYLACAQPLFSLVLCFQIMVLLTFNRLQKMSLWKKLNKIGFCLLFNSFVVKLCIIVHCPHPYLCFMLSCTFFSPSILSKQGSEWIFIFFCWKRRDVKDKHIYIIEPTHTKMALFGYYSFNQQHTELFFSCRWQEIYALFCTASVRAAG